MEYVYLLLAVIAAIVWVCKKIAAFFRWATKSLQSAGVSGPTLTPPQTSTPPRTPTSAPRVLPGPSAAAAPGRRPNMPRRLEATQPMISRKADADNKFSQIAASEPDARNVAQETPRPTPPETSNAPLFSSEDDLRRAVILQEILRPPVSRRPSFPR